MCRVIRIRLFITIKKSPSMSKLLYSATRKSLDLRHWPSCYSAIRKLPGAHIRTSHSWESPIHVQSHQKLFVTIRKSLLFYNQEITWCQALTKLLFSHQEITYPCAKFLEDICNDQEITWSLITAKPSRKPQSRDNIIKQSLLVTFRKSIYFHSIKHER